MFLESSLHAKVQLRSRPYIRVFWSRNPPSFLSVLQTNTRGWPHLWAGISESGDYPDLGVFQEAIWKRPQWNHQYLSTRSCLIHAPVLIKHIRLAVSHSTPSCKKYLLLLLEPPQWMPSEQQTGNQIMWAVFLTKKKFLFFFSRNLTALHNCPSRKNIFS